MFRHLVTIPEAMLGKAGPQPCGCSNHHRNWQSEAVPSTRGQSITSGNSLRVECSDGLDGQQAPVFVNLEHEKKSPRFENSLCKELGELLDGW